MIMNRLASCVAACALGSFVVLVSPLDLFAQGADMALRGAVHDSSGGALPGATVTAKNVETGLERISVTNQDGRFTIPSLPPGTYDVQSALEGFATVLRRNQTFTVGTTITLDFSMQIATLSETVEVQAQAPVLEATKSTLARVVQKAELDDLPVVSRSFSDLAALAPGVQASSNGSISIGNSFAYQTGYRVDGASTEGANTGGQSITFAQDWIQEFSVVTQQFPAEYGQASGGVVNAITRSGTNRFSGRAYGFFQNDKLNALPAFTTTKPPLSQQRLGATFGGPITRDRLFFFGGFESLHNDSSNVVVSSFPSQNGVYPTTNDTKLAMAKLDYQANTSSMLHLRVNTEVDSADNGGVGGISTLEHGTSSSGKGMNGVGSWTWTISPSVLSEARVGWLGQDSGSSCNYAAQHPDGPWFQLAYPTAQFGCPAAFGPTGSRQFQAYETVTVSRSKHQLKMGGQATHNTFWTRLRNNIDGSYGFASDTPFSIGNPASYPTTFVIFQGPTVGFELPSWAFGGFVQDSWSASDNLTLNLGVRYDVDYAPAAVNSFVQVDRGFHPIDTDYGDVAPRFGIAWTPFHNDRRTLIRGGVGMYRDMGHTQIGAVYMSNTVNITKQININANSSLLNPFFPDKTKIRQILANALLANGLPDASSLPGTTAAGFDVQQNIKIPGTVQATIGLAHTVRDGLDVTIDYAFIRGFDQLLAKNTNITPVTFKPINPLFTTINTWGNEGWFTSHSLLVSSNIRSHRGDSVRLAYTLAFARSNTTGGTSSRSVFATNPFDLSEDEGPSDNDIRHTLSASGSFRVPLGIQLSPIVSYHTALPYSASTTVQAPGATDPFIHRPSPRNSLRGDDFVSVDARLSRQINIGGRRSVTAFLEGFNLTNATNYTTYIASVQSASFGQPNAAGPKRRAQLGVRVDF